MIEKFICNENVSLLAVLKVINDNAMGVAFITDNSERLCGVVTDGDIRRALLNNVLLDEKVINITNKEFVFSLQGESYESMMGKISHKVKVIPIVNSNHQVVDVFECNNDVHFPVAIPNLNGNEFKYLVDAFLSTWISSSGEYIDKFENSFSEYSDCKYGVTASNGTAALHLALLALDVGFGDEVIVPDLTFAATINTVLHANAKPVIVDVDEDSWCIDPGEIEKAITPKTKAIIPVHLYGQSCDMGAIMEIAKKHDLKVIEDCAEAHGAMFAGEKVGSFGDVGCFSFFGNKVITTGEGGMCTTNNIALNEKMRVLRDHGMSKNRRYWHDIVGYNYRMTNLQAAIGLAQLERIDEIHLNRRKYEDNYKSILSQDGFVFQNDLEGRERITWLVSILLDESLDKNSYIEKLKNNGIDARPFFYPLTDMDIYKPYSSFPTPVSKMLSKRGLNLPTYESLKSMQEIRNVFKDMNHV